MFWQRFRKKLEARSADESWAQITATPLMGGMTPRMAENLSAVVACTDLVATSIASCPAYVYSTAGGRRTELPAPPFLVRPNRHQCWPDFVAFVIRQMLLWGNAVIQVAENERGEVAELRPWPWPHVSWQLKDGRMTYSVADGEGVYGPAGTRWIFTDEEAIHVKDACDSAHVGVSRLRRASAVFTQASKANEAAERLYEDAVRPSGALTMDGKLDGDSRQNLRAMLKGFTANNGKGALILDGGMKWQTFSLNAEDAELLDSRRFSVEEICRVFQCPPHLVGEMSKASYNVAEASMRSFVQWTLLPICTRLESAFSHGVLPSGQRLVIDLEGLMRADAAAQWTAWEKASTAGILAVDEVREQAGYSPLGGKFAVPRTFNEAGGLHSHEDA